MALALDGSAQSATGANATQTITLTTTNANDIIIVAAVGNVSITGVSGGSLTWASRATEVNGTLHTTVWWALATNALNAVTITVTLASATFNTCYAFGISGANTVSPFDPNGALPVQSTSSAPSYSTTNANNFVMAIWTESSTGTPGTPSGFNIIGTNSGVFGEAAYQIVSSAQSNTTVSLPGSGTWASILDAVTAASTATAPVGMQAW